MPTYLEHTATASRDDHAAAATIFVMNLQSARAGRDPQRSAVLGAAEELAGGLPRCFKPDRWATPEAQNYVHGTLEFALRHGLITAHGLPQTCKQFADRTAGGPDRRADELREHPGPGDTDPMAAFRARYGGEIRDLTAEESLSRFLRGLR
jgi:hypothetical protein